MQGPLHVLVACFFFFTLLTLVSCKTIVADLHVRQPKPQQPNSHRGFPQILHIVEPLQDRYPILQPLLRKLGLQTQQWTSRYHNVQLYGGMVAVGEYYAKVKIGGQLLRVQIDTGSATLAAPVEQCTNCKRGDMRYSLNQSDSGIAKMISCEDEQCGANTCSSFSCGACSTNRQACCSKFDTTKCAFHLNFGDGSGAKGVLIQDELQWGDVKFPVTFGGITSDSPDFERSQVDGILGMAYPTLACNPTCVTPTFESMLQKMQMKDMFSICITYDSGRIVLGDYDDTMSTKPVSWVPLQLSNPPSFYSFPLIGNFKVDNEELQMPRYSKAIVDSGTTLIVFSQTTFQTFKNYLQENYCDVPGLCSPQTWFRPAHCTKISEEDRQKLPTITFSLQGFDLTLSPSDYLINYASKGSEYWCVGIMALNSMSGGVDVILGNTVMKKYVTIYDRANQRVGFAESDTQCGLHTKDTPNAPLPVPDPNQPKKQPRAPVTNPPDSSQPTSSGDGHDAKCQAATTCNACAKLEGCTWDISTGACKKGSATKYMCTFNFLSGRVVYIVGAVFAAVVVIIAIAAVVVGKRRADVGETTEEEPLARNEVDTRAAFAIDEEDAQM